MNEKSIRLILWSLLFAGLLIKIPFLNRPFVGYFGSYQSTVAMMASMMERDPQAIAIPKTFVIQNGQPSIHPAYYPFSALFASLAHKFLPGTLDFWGRFQAAVLMFLSSWLLFEILIRLLDARTSLIATLFFTFSPMVLLSGISFQNEAAGIFFLLLSIRLTQCAFRASNFTAGLIFSLAIIARVHFLAVLPVCFFLIKGRLRTTVFLLGAILPAAAWFGFAAFLEARYSDYVLTGFWNQTHEGRIGLFHPLLKEGEFYERMAKILAGQWATPIVSTFAFMGFFVADPDRKIFIFKIWLLGVFATIFILPQKVFDHPFYLVAGVAPAAVLAASALKALWAFLNRISRFCLIVGFFLLSFRFYLPPALSAAEDAQLIPAIGKAVQALTQPDDWILAEHGTSADILYYCQRLGWGFDLQMDQAVLNQESRHERMKAEGYGDPVTWLEKLRAEGARYFVVSRPEVLELKEKLNRYLRTNYAVVTNPSPYFLMFDLTQRIAQ